MGLELAKDQQDFYNKVREQCRRDVEEMNSTMVMEWDHLNSEIARVQNLIAELEGRKQSVGQMYAAASAMVNQENDLDISPAINAEEGAEG